MKVIHKFRLETGAQQVSLSLKQGYKIVHSEYVLVDKSVFIWVEQTLDVEVPSESVILKVINSGEPVPDRLNHVMSVVDSFTPEAYHIFEIPEAVSHRPKLNLAQLTYTAA